MTSFVLRRVAQTVVVLFSVSVIVFSLVHLTPGDPVEVMLAGENVSAEQKDALRRQLGLDRPLAVQYGEFVSGAATGDLGTSLRRGIPVAALMATTLPATLELTLSAVVIAVVIAVPVALVSALRQGSAWDRVGSVGALFGISMPSFWLGIMLILIVSVNLGLLPPTGRLGHGLDLQQQTGFAVIDSILARNWPALRSALTHLVLPALTLGTAIGATMTRVLRSGLLETKGQDFVDALRARGLRSRTTVVHLLRNAMPPTVTVMAIRIGALLGGAIVVETVFSWPGLGRLIVDGIRSRDYPVVQGSVLVLAVLFVLINLAADLLNGWLDPRIRYGRKETA